MSECLFCSIANGDVPSHSVYVSSSVIAFLDINPIREGHLQIASRQHYRYYDDLPLPVAAEILAIGQRVAPVLRSLYRVDRVAFLFTGGDIPHAHAHVVPMVEKTDITSRRYIANADVTFRDMPRTPESTLAETAALIRSALEVHSGRA